MVNSNTEPDIREKLIVEMKAVFRKDQKRIDHAMAVLNFAERLNKKHPGDKVIVMAAAILHDIGIPAAEKKYNSAAGNYQEIEGPPIARGILEKYDIDSETTEHVCKIIANHHSAKDIDTDEFRIIFDADWLVNAEEIAGRFNSIKNGMMDFINKTFKTEAGRKIATEIYVN